jgi:hypothetical protein
MMCVFCEPYTDRNRVVRPGEYGTVRIPRRGFVRSYRAYFPFRQEVGDLRLEGHAHAHGQGDGLE